MFQTKDRIIGDNTYRVTQLPTGEGRRILVKLVKVIGPAISVMVEELGDGKDAPTILDSEMSSVGEAIRLFLDRVEQTDLDDLVTTFGRFTVVLIGDKVLPLSLEMQELHFSGKYLEMFKWLAFCLEWNYSDFFASSKIVAATVAGFKKSGRGSSE
jgi:hypothetical protein